MSNFQAVTNRLVRRYMEQHHMSQTQLGASIGLKQTDVSARLRNRVRWSIDDLDALAGLGLEIRVPVESLAGE